jgi:hypothetical protein
MKRLRARALLTVLVLPAFGAHGCGSSSSQVRSQELDPLAPEVLYPLTAGNVWSYNVDTGEEIPTLAITRVVRRDGATVEVSSGGDPVVYELRDGGIFKPATSTWLLRAPIAVGESWASGPGMTARVASIDESVTVRAGSFEACVLVEEEGDERQIRTTYCPEVGPVLVQSMVRLGLREASIRAELLGTALQ